MLLAAPGAGVAARLGAAPLVLLAGCAALALPRWGITSAIFMLAYFSYGVVELLTRPDGRQAGAAFAAVAIVVFLAALDAERRR